MAKRRKEKDEDEDKPFKLPKFDEEKFLKRERRNIKSTFIAFLFGILIAIVCFGFWALMSGEETLRWPLVVLVALANAAFIKYIYIRINLDISDFTKKNWFSSYIIYLFTWLIVFIVLVNPPFYDDENPNIVLTVLPEMQEPGGDIIFVAKITDNVQIDTNSITLEITDPNDNITTLKPDAFEFNNIMTTFIFNNTEDLLGDFSYSLSAKDTNGFSTIRTGSFEYSTDTITVPTQDLEGLVGGQDIEIEVKEEISPRNFRVYYTLNDGEEINVDRENVNNKDEYETSADFEGWEENTNYTMKAYVEVSYYFSNLPVKYTNIIQDTTIYNVSTGDDSRIGDEIPPMPWNWTQFAKGEAQAPVILNYDHYSKNKDINKQILLPYPHGVQAPGFEILVFIAALIIVGLIYKRKKKNRRNQK